MNAVFVLIWIVAAGGGVTSGAAYFSTEAACRAGERTIEAVSAASIASCIRDEMPAGDF